MLVKETRKYPRPGDGTPGPGRPKGVPNKTTTLLKDAAIKAAEIAGGGGPDGLVNYLVIQAEKNPGPFLALLGRILPLQVSGEGVGNTIIVEIVKHGKATELSGPVLDLDAVDDLDQDAQDPLH